MSQERLIWSEIAQARVLKEFLGVADDIDRALKAAHGKDEGIVQGLELVQKNIVHSFEKLGVKRVDCSGDFDPQFHEALMYVDSQDHRSGQVCQELRPGYLLQGKVLRHAQVSVAR